MAWMGAFGFADDYIKVVLKNKGGLPARVKLVGQVTLGLIVGSVLYWHPEFAQVRTLTYLPFIKNQVIDYSLITDALGLEGMGWLVYLPVVIFIITSVSNAVNLTDGLDGLATGVTLIAVAALTGVTYVTGDARWAGYLDLTHRPEAAELTVFCGALVGASLGFLWYNAPPAEVFMGDVGSLGIGGAIGTVAVLTKQEFMMVIIGGVFIIEAASVAMQVSYFQFTKRSGGTGKRIFKMSPLHHHFEVSGWKETKIVFRFLIVAILFALLGLSTLKLR
jgi:phospho-N-acetylmuramoyl-pentapeptide-transferase